MKRHSCFTLMAVALAIAFTAGSATGQTGAYISKVEGAYAPGKVSPGSTLRLYIAVRNDTTEVLGGLTLGFEVNETGGLHGAHLPAIGPRISIRQYSLCFTASRITGMQFHPTRLPSKAQCL